MTERNHPYKVVCAWCGEIVKEGIEPISHTICEECAEREREKYGEKRFIIRTEDY